MLVTPARRGTFIVPAEVRWIIKRYFADLTSRSLRERCRRGTLVVPAESEWIIQNCAPDPTSGSLQEEIRRGMFIMPVRRGVLVTPISEGHACRARGSAMDHQTVFRGPDKRVPPSVRHVKVRRLTRKQDADASDVLAFWGKSNHIQGDLSFACIIRKGSTAGPSVVLFFQLGVTSTARTRNQKEE